MGRSGYDKTGFGGKPKDTDNTSARNTRGIKDSYPSPSQRKSNNSKGKDKAKPKRGGSESAGSGVVGFLVPSPYLSHSCREKYRT